MVANVPMPVAPRFGSLTPVAFDPRRRVLRLTVEDVEAMIRAGVVAEDASTELLDGQLVLVDRSGRGEAPEMANRGHVICTEKCAKLARQIDDSTRHVESQQPLICSPTYAPVPDVMIIRGTLDDHASTVAAADALCVIEVADSSYARDTGEKLRAYARAGVPQYVVIDLARRVAEVRETPDRDAGTYPPPTTIAADGTLALRVGAGGETFEIRLANVLP